MVLQKLLLSICALGVSFSYGQENFWSKQKEQNTTYAKVEQEFKKITYLKKEIYALDSDFFNHTLKSKNTADKTTVIFPIKGNPKAVFEVEKMQVLHPDLEKKYPTLQAYQGYLLEDPSVRIYFNRSAKELHAMIVSNDAPVQYIDPYTKDKKSYVLYQKDHTILNQEMAPCLVKDNITNTKQLKLEKNHTAVNDVFLRTYRLALVCTGEYAQFHLNNQGISAGASEVVKKQAVLNAMQTTMTRVNGIYQRDLGVRLQIVANNDRLIFLDAVTDGLTNNNASIIINEFDSKCDTQIGFNNYDLGHVFTTGAGGLAGAGPCISSKANGVTGISSPIGDPYDVDYVAHEIGHQFGANHTFNNYCSGNRSDNTAVEPGSGSTIMAYAGVCGPNIQYSSDAHFHSTSILEMWNYIANWGTCASLSNTSNTAPVITPGQDYTIPKSTPYVVEGNVTDANTSDILSYTWEQTDTQEATMPPVSTSSQGPLYRALAPSESTKRYFPALQTVLAGNLSSQWEVTPSVGRTINLRFVARDNNMQVGRVATDDIVITVDGNAGPFYTTSLNSGETLEGATTTTITWEVANTTIAPINATHVNILLSTDSGNTFATTLIANTPNDGSQQITLPNIDTTTARIMIQPTNNVFYAVNTADFSITKTLSVTQNELANFSVYPNPFTENIAISFNSSIKDKTKIKLYDIHGNKVLEQIYNNNAGVLEKRLHLSTVASGIYFLEVIHADKKTYVKLIKE